MTPLTRPDFLRVPQLCAQNALDVATHLAAVAGLDVPDSVRAIDALVRLSVIPAAFGATFRDVAGFRNVVVHGYLDVDPATLLAVLNDRLEDFETFAQHVERGLPGSLTD